MVVATSLLKSRVVATGLLRRSMPIVIVGSDTSTRFVIRSFSEQHLRYSALNQSDVQLHGMTLSMLHQQQHLTQDDESRCALAYCLSFSNDETDFQRNFAQLDSIMKAQLAFNEKQFRSSVSSIPHRRSGVNDVPLLQQQLPLLVDTEPLPRTLEDALRPSKTRSIVITEKDAPFRIVNVNSCWEQLCGYSYIESKGKTLGSLLRGPQTDPLTATSMIAKLLQGEPDVGATLINYKKDGQPFYNRIRAGPIYNQDTGEISHFVGLLQEVNNSLERNKVTNRTMSV